MYSLVMWQMLAGYPHDVQPDHAIMRLHKNLTIEERSQLRRQVRAILDPNNDYISPERIGKWVAPGQYGLLIPHINKFLYVTVQSSAACNDVHVCLHVNVDIMVNALRCFNFSRFSLLIIGKT